jgi:hypothetical protein
VFASANFEGIQHGYVSVSKLNKMIYNKLQYKYANKYESFEVIQHRMNFTHLLPHQSKDAILICESGVLRSLDGDMNYFLTLVNFSRNYFEFAFTCRTESFFSCVDLSHPSEDLNQ